MIIIHSLPFIINPPTDFDTFEKIVACDAVSLGLQVATVLYGISLTIDSSRNLQ
jgi:hypothetical protein